MSDREIVLDTETTGLDPGRGDRVVEIGCVELINHVPSGENFQHYFNPERDMPEDALRVHGLTSSFLAGQPLFAQRVDQLLEFVADSPLIIHNAPFDLGFLNAELERAARPAIANPVIDTVALARTVHPGARVSLDALCKHYGIDTARRSLHGALLDAEILAEVYLELIGGRQVAMALRASAARPSDEASGAPATTTASRPRALAPRLSAEELAAHNGFVAGLGRNALWRRYERGE